jgi:hypothetical protein
MFVFDGGPRAVDATSRVACILRPSQERNMTFQVSDLMMDLVVVDKKRKPCRNPKCGVHTRCTAKTNYIRCTAKTCRGCTHTGASTCSGQTDDADCSCHALYERNLAALKSELHSRLDQQVRAA